MPRIRPYNPAIKENDYLFKHQTLSGEEEKVRQWFLRELIETYGYNLKDIEIEVSKEVGNSGSNEKKRLRVDVRVKDENSVKGCAIVVELKSFNQEVIKLKRDYEIQLISYIDGFYPKFAVITDGKRICFVRRFYVDNEPKEVWLTDLPTFEEYKGNITPSESKRQFIELPRPQNRSYDSSIGKLSFLDRVFTPFFQTPNRNIKQSNNSSLGCFVILIVAALFFGFSVLMSDKLPKNNSSSNSSVNTNYYPTNKTRPIYQNSANTEQIRRQSNPNYPTPTYSDKRILPQNSSKSDSVENIENLDNQTSNEDEPNIKVYESDNWKEFNSSVPKTDLTSTPEKTPAIRIEEPKPTIQPIPTLIPTPEKKPEIIEVTICSYSGRLPNPYCPSRVTRKFRKSETPTEICTEHKKKNKVIELLKKIPNRIP